MSALAKKIAKSGSPTAPPTRRGPPNACHPIYGTGDLEDWEAVEAVRLTRRADGSLPEWRDVQEHIDKLAGVEHPLSLDKFKYHWRRRCYCWPVDLRR